jgi:hypothetical protein
MTAQANDGQLPSLGRSGRDRTVALARALAGMVPVAGAQEPRVRRTYRELRKAGGRWWDRTTDPYDVNVVLSR